MRRVGGDRVNGAVDLGEEVAGADAAPMPLRGQAGFPAGGALAEQVAVGEGEQIADLRGAVELVGRGRAKGAEGRGGDGPMVFDLAREADAGVEEALIELRRLGRGWSPAGAGELELLAVVVLEPVDAAGGSEGPVFADPHPLGVCAGSRAGGRADW